ncbi:MAG: DUF4139 domain-containing protein [Planctomycetales bacterium]|nr:DUF4139 domain-containing protein [bacterium]UNM07950.1 MAG: DUF4139 domain-containing protein [Planctomycetales bacterium]
MKHIAALGLTLLLLATQSAFAGSAGDVEDVYLTVYNGNLSLIRELRSFELSQGSQALVLDDVSGQLNPATVHLSFPEGVDFELLEQNFDYDLVNTAKMLERFIGREITLHNDYDGTRMLVTLLSTSGGTVVRDSAGQILLNPPGRIILPAGSADELLLRPTLSWLLWSQQAGRQRGEISYLSGGLDWNADYVLMLNADDTASDLEGWVTLTNNSGTTYKDAHLKLVAGDVNRVREELGYALNDLAGTVAQNGMGGGGGFQEESFFEYHLYDLDRPTTIRNSQQKQIGLLTANDFPVNKKFLFNGQYGGDVRVAVEFTNSEEEGLGMPLPAGVVRVFKADSKGQAQFVGEDRIDHTPRDEDLSIYIGNAFDIVGEATQLDYTDIGQGYTQSYKVVLKNHKEGEDVVVTVRADIGGDWQMDRSSLPWQKKDATTAEWEVPVPADGETELTYTYRVVWR